MGTPNKQCPYHPCHKGADPDKFTCDMCYCPMYPHDCKGTPNWLVTKRGNRIKDCSECLLPHENPEEIIRELTRITDPDKEEKQ